MIDEVKIYSVALTADQIKFDYNQGKAAILGSSSSNTGSTAPGGSASQEYCVPGSTDPCSPPIAEWKLDEKTGTTGYDTSENSNNATLGTGNSAPSWSIGKIGAALKFDGSNDYLDIGSGPSSVKTVEFWVNPTTTTEYPLDLNGTAYVWINSGVVTAVSFTSPSIYVNGIGTSTISANSATCYRYHQLCHQCF